MPDDLSHSQFFVQNQVEIVKEWQPGFRVPYGKGTEADPCDECERTPTRHCCYFWEDE